MADLGRQLQEYLAQSKAATTAAPSAAPSPPPAGRSQLQQEEEAGAGSAGSWLSALRVPAWPWAEAGPRRWERLAGSALCLLLAALCFALAALHAPLLPLRARKFALLWSLGSLCLLGAAALLRGPAMLREPNRASLLYAAALAGTLYAALGLRSAPLALLGAALQIGAAASAALAALPGGAAGLRGLGGLLRTVLRRGTALPI